MSEIQRWSGPADRVRDAIVEAEKMDTILAEQARSVKEYGYLPDHAVDLRPITDRDYDELNVSLPIIGQEVAVVGYKLEKSSNPEFAARGITKLILANTIDYDAPTIGIYRGIDNRLVHTKPFPDGDEQPGDDIQSKVVHVVQTGPERYYIDLNGEPRSHRPQLHVYVRDSRISPLEPLNAHSERLMAIDKQVSDRITQIVHKSSSLRIAMRNLMNYYNGGLRVQVDEEQKGLNHLRISLANSLLKERLDTEDGGGIAEVDDAIIGYPRRGEPIQSNHFSRYGKRVEFLWSHVTILPGYKRHPDNPNRAIYTGQEELYLRGKNEDGEDVAAMLRELTAIS